MLRKLRRSVARYRMERKGVKLFNNYSIVEGGRKKKGEKSFFAKHWREYSR